jgi:hypothetical protein
LLTKKKEPKKKGNNSNTVKLRNTQCKSKGWCCARVRAGVSPAAGFNSLSFVADGHTTMAAAQTPIKA